MFGDKQFNPQRPLFPTPADIPEETGCRTFRIPSDPAWFALFMGAILPLTDPENYQQFEGGVSRETAAEIFFDLVETTYENAEGGCEACVAPGGTKIIRVNPNTGRIEELTDGEWQEPTGDYTIPPVPPREGGTPQDQMCLAAANAANTLKLLYENLSDSYSAGLSTGEALTNFIIGIAEIILAVVALWAAAVIAVVGIIFSIVYDTLQYLTADLWDDDFDKTMKCILFDCASNDDGVVTFDYNCVLEALASETNPYDLTTTQLRLFGQLTFILSFIGADGLNLAGATTAVPSADCNDCPNEWCYNFVFSEGQQGWSVFTADGGNGTYSGGAFRSVATGSPLSERLSIHVTTMSPMTLTQVYVEFSVNGVSGGATRAVYSNAPGSPFTIGSLNTASPVTLSGTWTTSDLVLALDTYANAVGENTIVRIQLRGTGINPFGEDNCE